MTQTAKEKLLIGNCLDTLKTLPDNSIDSIVTDPPYGIEFMGKEWDSFKTKKDNEKPGKATGQTKTWCSNESSGIGVGGPRFSTQTKTDAVNFQLWFEQVAKECLRVLKPGGHLLAFGGTRMYHRMTVAIEDAGFEIRDSIHWTYGSGFPKSLDISKAIDKAAKVEREPDNYTGANNLNKVFGKGMGGGVTISKGKPTTKEAKQWQGWGTALKPSHEPIVLARKPLIGTVAENVLQHSTGGINIDATRIGTDDTLNGGAYAEQGTERDDGWGMQRGGAGDYKQPTGRFPANTLLTHNHDCQDTCTPNCPVELFPNSKGMATQNSGANINIYGGNSFNKSKTTFPEKRIGFNDDGSASRFFHNSQWTPADDITPFIYQAKAGKKERNAGLDGLPVVKTAAMAGNMVDSQRLAGNGSPINTPERQNFHPTVKPVELIRYLIRMVTPPKGTVLDPFLGSGTTAVAAILEGFDWKGCEMTEDYIPIIKGRIKWAEKEAKKKAKQEELNLDPEA